MLRVGESVQGPLSDIPPYCASHWEWCSCLTACISVSPAVVYVVPSIIFYPEAVQLVLSSFLTGIARYVDVDLVSLWKKMNSGSS